MTQIASLRVALEANTTGFRKGLDGATRRVSTFAARTTAAAAAVAGAFAVAFKGAVDDANQLDNLALRLGTTTTSLSELRYVASQAGIDFGTFSTALQRMVRRLDEVSKTGKGVAAPALKELGLDIEKLSSAPVPRQFEMIAEAMFKLKTQAERVRLAMAIFDTEGVKLVQTMAGGEKGVRRLRLQAHELGLVVTKEMAEAATAASAEWDKLTSVMDAASKRILLSFAPEITAALEMIRKGFRKNLPVALNQVSEFTESASRSMDRLRLAMLDFGDGNFSAGAKQLGFAIDDISIAAGDASSSIVDAFGKNSIAGMAVNNFARGVQLIHAVLAGVGSIAGQVAAGTVANFKKLTGQMGGQIEFGQGIDATSAVNEILLKTDKSEARDIEKAILRNGEEQLTVLRAGNRILITNANPRATQ